MIMIMVTLKTAIPLQKPTIEQITMQNKNKSTHTKNCGSEIVSSKVNYLQGKKLVQATEVWDIEEIKKHFQLKAEFFRAGTVRYAFDT